MKKQKQTKKTTPHQLTVHLNESWKLREGNCPHLSWVGIGVEKALQVNTASYFLKISWLYQTVNTATIIYIERNKNEI